MVISENLVLHLRLNAVNGQQTSDTVGNTHSLAGNTHLTGDSSFGHVMSFDGDGDFVQCPPGFSPGNDPWTMSLWFKADRLNGANILYNKENLYEAQVENGFFKYAWRPHWNWDGGNSFPVESGKWYHATVVYDGQSQKMYRNGTKVYERTQTGAIGSNDRILLLGARNNGNEYNFFQGQMAHFRMYNRALNPAEIREIMTTDAAGLIVHFPLNEHTEDNRIIDDTGNGHIASLQADPSLVPDEKFGAVLNFDGIDDIITVPDSPDLQIKGDMAVSCWVFIEKSVNDWVRIVGKGFGVKRNYGLWYHPVRNQWLFQQMLPDGSYHNAMNPAHVPGPIQLNKWYHVAGIRKNSTCYLYLNGQKIGSKEKIGIPAVSTDPLTIGAADIHAHHSGKIAQVRLYGRAVSQEEIAGIIQEDQVALASFRQTHPLEFSFLNDQNEATMFIDEDAGGHPMHLIIKNSSKRAIQFPGTVQPEASKDNHNFALHFRPGTLLEASLSQIALSTDPGWRMKLLKEGDQTAIIYLHATHAPRMEPGESIKIGFSGFRADGTHGSRGTRVQLSYQGITFDGATSQIRGSRISHVNIVNHQGRKNIPLHVGFHGSNTILNDAIDNSSGTSNQLKLRLTNTEQLDPANPSRSNISFRGQQSDRPSQFTINFDVQQAGENKEWALGTASQVAAIQLQPDPIVLGGMTVNWVPATGAPGTTFRLDRDASIPSGVHIGVTITNIKSSLATGHTNLYLHYENIPGYWDGSFVAVIEKSPLVFRTDNNGFQKIGIGTANPKAKLDIGINSGHAIRLEPGRSQQVVIGRNDSNGLIFDYGNGQAINSTASLSFNIDSDNSNSTRCIDFRANGKAFQGGVNLMRIKENGDIGIGTDKPKARLHICSTKGIELLLEADKDNSGEGDQPRITLSQDNGIVKGQLGYFNSSNHLTLANRFGDAALLMHSNGNIGIGTDNPSSKFHVIGDSRVDGKIWGFADAYLAGSLQIEGNSQIKGNTVMAGGLQVVQKASFVSDVEVSQNAKIHGNLEVNGNLIGARGIPRMIGTSAFRRTVPMRIEINGLDLNRDQMYMLVMKFHNTKKINYDYKMYMNGDINTFNYHSVMNQQLEGANKVHHRKDASIANAGGEAYHVFTAYVIRSASGNITVHGQGGFEVPGTSGGGNYQHWSFFMSYSPKNPVNLTSLMLVAGEMDDYTKEGEFGTSSEVMVYKWG